MALTARQQRFVDEYLLDLNATQAAIRAGYTAKNADVTGPRMLGNVGVAAEIRRRQAKRAIRVETSQDYVLTNLTEVVERTMQRAPVMVRQGKEMVQLEDEEGRDVWQFDARGAVSSLQLIGKHHGMFTDRHEHTFPDLTPEDRTNRLAAILNGARAKAKAHGANGNGAR